MKSNTPSSLPNSNAVSRLQLHSHGHHNQPPTSNIKGSASSSALYKWLSALPQNQRRQHSHKFVTPTWSTRGIGTTRWFTHNGDPLQGMKTTNKTLRQSRYLRTQGSSRLHTHFPGRNSSGPRTFLQRRLPGLVPERQKVKTSCTRKTSHRVYRQGQACLHIQRRRQRKHYLQTYDHRNFNHNTF
jgi:hypothetical protein